MSKTKLKANTRIYEDLEIRSDRAEEFMASFAREFDIDMSAYNPEAHFLDPVEGKGALIKLLYPMSLFVFDRPTWRKVLAQTPVRLSDLTGSMEAGKWIAPEGSFGCAERPKTRWRSMTTWTLVSMNAMFYFIVTVLAARLLYNAIK